MTTTDCIAATMTPPTSGHTSIPPAWEWLLWASFCGSCYWGYETGLLETPKMPVRFSPPLSCAPLIPVRNTFFLFVCLLFWSFGPRFKFFLWILFMGLQVPWGLEPYVSHSQSRDSSLLIFRTSGSHTIFFRKAQNPTSVMPSYALSSLMPGRLRDRVPGEGASTAASGLRGEHDEGKTIWGSQAYRHPGAQLTISLFPSSSQSSCVLPSG